MAAKDPLIDKLVKEQIPVLIGNKKYLIKPKPEGTCGGCIFINKTCPITAINICNSNGGNILKELENGR